MKKFFLVQISFCVFCFISNAQTISNVIAKQTGNNVTISYDLDCRFPVSVSLFYSEDGGKNYNGPLASVKGDVGKKVDPGTNKKIFWNVLSDVNIVLGDNIVFKVSATKDITILSEEIIDGTIYKVIEVEEQVWMAENLRRAYNGKYWCYDNKNENCEKYGYLYTWENAKEACPSGWKLPSEKDWDILINIFGGNKIAGGKLKSLDEWLNQNVDATNESKFNAIPGGYRMDNGTYQFIGKSAFYWLSDEFDSENGKYISLSGLHGQIISNKAKKSFGFSVRCIKE